VFDLVIIGHFVMDLIISPKISHPRVTLGGAATFVSLAANKLDARVGVVSKVGKDFQKQLLWLRKANVDLSMVQIAEDASTTRFMLTYYDGKRKLQLRVKAPQIVPEDIQVSLRAKVIHVAPVANELSLEVIRKLRNRASLLSIDPQGFLREFDEAGYMRSNLRNREPTKLKSESNPDKQIGNILSYGWHLKKNGRADTTIETAVTRLKRLSQLCNIEEPEEVKATLAHLQWQNSSKKQVTSIYTGYLRFIGKTWTKPKYAIQSKIPFIPTEKEIDSLIASGTTKTSTLLQLLKETGARIGEIDRIKWADIDLQRKTIYITAEKGSNSRILPISTKLIAMLNNLPKINENVFQTKKHGLRSTYEALRRRTIKKLSNPRLKRITLHTFRHWKATMEYHKTKDIIHVKTILGHKQIESTMTYINIESALWLSASDEWTCKTANTVKEATQLIEAGFEYTTEINKTKLFRKRK